ncbi:MAG: FAD-dependent oxidoreductase, partial [Elusimicrobia bacterium]|nr:FAD-dependent oxidoreductase [Elusimicrobiota bacterium]
QPGGQLWWSEKIENYPGFPEGVQSYRLAQMFEEQAKRFGAEIIAGSVEGISKKDMDFSVELSDGRNIGCGSVIIASGASMRKLGVRGEKELMGKGVSYCAVCDGPLYRGKRVAVVGGGNTACEEAVYLTRFAEKVFIVHRRRRLRAVGSVLESVENNPGIELFLEKKIKSINGGEFVQEIEFEGGEKLAVEGVFVFVGLDPNTGFVREPIGLDKGFIITDSGLMTSEEGIFAAGDCRAGALRQVVSACGEGAYAAEAARKYVEKKKGTAYDW